MTYRIDEGEHYTSTITFGIHLGKVYSKELVRFDDSCLYEPFDTEHDSNKGTGFTYSLFNDKNSVRWSWRQHPTLDDCLELGIYCHVNGKILESKARITVKTDKYYLIELNNYHHVGSIKLKASSLSDISEIVYLDATIKPAIGWNNRPYFGGNNPAPHDMEIDIKKT